MLKIYRKLYLIGENNEIKLCKDKKNENFKNCKIINNKNCLCIECDKEFF